MACLFNSRSCLSYHPHHHHHYYYYTWLLLLASRQFAFCQKSTAKIPVHLAGLWPVSDGWRGGLEALPAVELAIETLNNQTDILPDYEVFMHWKNTKNSPSVGMRKFFELVTTEPRKVILIGPISSLVSVHVSLVAASWNLLQISYSARSSEMDNKKLYPYLFRTRPGDKSLNPAREAVLEHFGWNSVAMLAQEHAANLFTETMEDLSQILFDKGFTVLTTSSFDEGDISFNIQRLKAMDARIIIGNFFADTAEQVFCEAYKQGLTWPKRVWILSRWNPNQWWKDPQMNGSCTEQELYESQRYHIEIDYLTQSTVTNGAFGISAKDFKSSMKTEDCTICSFAFDAIMSAGVALHNVRESGLPLEDFSYDNHTYVTALSDALEDMVIHGMSGRVSFDSKGNRVSQAIILQSQDDDLVEVGLYDPMSQRLVTDGYADFKWHDDYVPHDVIKRGQEVMTYGDNVIGSIFLFAILGLCIALVAFVFNVRFRHKRLIKLSSPYMNNFILLGSLSCYLSVLLYGLDSKFLGQKALDLVCTARLGFLSSGFTVGFGAMFSKTWRMHKIMSLKSPLQVPRVKDIHLVGHLLALFVIDLAFFIVWLLVDPLKHHTKSIGEDNYVKQDYIVEQLVTSCECQYEVYWIGTLLVSKGVLLLFGIFLAWETRNIRVDVLNDSRLIGLSVYNTATVCILAVPLSFILDHKFYEAAYVIKSLLIILCTTVTLFIVFAPKALALYQNPDGNVTFQIQDTRVHATTTLNDTRLEQIKQNISMQKKLEDALKERDIKIKEMEQALSNGPNLGPNRSHSEV